MRLIQKRQTLDLLATIEEGFDFASNSSHEEAIEMLQECNNGLAFLSDLVCEEKKVQKLLEKEIDLTINAIHFLLSDSQEVQLLTSYILEIKEVLNSVRYVLINDVQTEIEIAFMPYKVSMWDSLESIYREAEQDPNCTCYVIPIPYYEKNSQGQVIKSCYEGDLFPKDIDVTHFDSYDFENRRPDIIYIHNPYDQYNTLTMVHPRFFSNNLAQYTDMLVYVPYFIAGSSDKLSLSLFPAFKNVSKIIVQSDISKSAFLTNGFDSSKVMNLGSPKLDAMLAAVEKPIETPLSWKDTIENKKVILFNSGIADLLANSTWVEQIEQVINHFLNNEQCALIWRPHPLTEVTLKTMRPNLIEKFKKVEDKLTQSKNIIIDKGNNIFPAVAVSDGIISDYSSVMLQYIITKKPVLGLLNKQMIENDRYYYADYSSCYFIQDISIAQFIDIVLLNEDYKKEERISRFTSSVTNADGTSGQKIHHTIRNEVISRLFVFGEER